MICSYLEACQVRVRFAPHGISVVGHDDTRPDQEAPTTYNRRERQPYNTLHMSFSRNTLSNLV